MTPRYQAVLLVAFGGPNRMEDVRPFLANVVRGRRVPAERLEDVVQHYARFGGRSPLIELTLKQAAALEADLAAHGRPLPVFVGMRNWTPYLHEALERMRGRGVRRALAVIMAPQQSYASWEQYQADVAAARDRVGPEAPQVDYLDPWSEHPRFIAAQADRVAAALAGVPEGARGAEALVFTAHSIPSAMAERSPYVAQLRSCARLVAERLGHARWTVAYQSRSGDPRVPWLEPDVGDAIRRLAREGAAAVVVVPIGFLCDHIEVLYDLDTEARAIAAEAGVAFHRAGTVMDHPAFIGMLGDLVRRRAQAAPDTGGRSEPPEPRTTGHSRD